MSQEPKKAWKTVTSMCNRSLSSFSAGKQSPKHAKKHGFFNVSERPVTCRCNHFPLLRAPGANRCAEGQWFLVGSYRCAEGQWSLVLAFGDPGAKKCPGKRLHLCVTGRCPRFPQGSVPQNMQESMVFSRCLSDRLHAGVTIFPSSELQEQTRTQRA